MSIEEAYKSKTISGENKYIVDLLVTFQTSPGDGLFQGRVSYDNETSTTEILSVIRVNMYRGQAECLETFDLRQFCYCLQKQSKH